MEKDELLQKFRYLVKDFFKTHRDELSQDINWKMMPDGETLFGNADLTSNDFVMVLLRIFMEDGARVIDSGLWQPFPNLAFVNNLPEGELHAEKNVDWENELGG